MEARQLKRLKELEEENRKLKQLYAEQNVTDTFGILVTLNPFFSADIAITLIQY
ncbi:MAG: hypothetical protein RL754_1286 [Bacteroidota bacterium]|jgi:hypothetical protein